MRVRFYCAWRDHEVDVEYGFGDARVPVEGEVITTDGSDPDFPKGEYRVGWVRWEIDQRGPRMATVYLQRSGADA